MDPEQIARLLSGQRQISRVGTAGETGMGIGMQLCRAYLKANQALIQIHSHNKLPQCGTRVELYFKDPQFPALPLLESPTVEEVLG
jgi:signal transduction histidine kinase